MNNTMRNSLDITIIFIVVLVALLYRRFDAFSNPQLWAEGGTQMLQLWETMHFISIFVIYAGYLITFPRLVTAVIGLLHISYYYIPLVYNLSTFLITFFVSVALWQSAIKLNIRHRIFYATIFLLLPVGNELFMDEASLGWITGLYLVNYVFSWDNKVSERYYILMLILLLTFSTSGPFSTILIPVIFILIYQNRKEISIKRLLPLLVILSGGIFQVISLKFLHPEAYSGRVESWGSFEVEHLHLLKLFTNNINQIFCLDRIPGISEPAKTILATIVLAGLIILFIISYRRIENKRKHLILLTAILFFGSFVVTYWPKESHIVSLGISRYYLIPYTCIGWLLIMAWDDKINLIYITIYLYLLSLHSNFLRTSLPDKKWREQIKEYYEGKRDTIDINPDGWHVVLPKRENYR